MSEWMPTWTSGTPFLKPCAAWSHRAPPVSVRELRTSLPAISKAQFDAAALALRSARKAFLSQHDYPRSLSPEDRDLLIDGQDGTYYVAITAITD